MKINYYLSQILGEKPLEIDVTSSPNGVYVRRDFKEIEKQEDFSEEKTTVKGWEYQEAFLSFDEWELYKNTLISNEINSNENSTAFDNYQKKLSTGVEYINGHKYKPKYINDYKNIMSDIKNATDLIKDLGGDASQILTQKFAIYDETGLVENMVMMSGLEVIDLYFFLYAKKEQYFAEYKLEKELT